MWFAPLVFILVLIAGAEGGINSLSLSLRIDEKQWETTKAELEKLSAVAKSQKMGPPVEMLLRNAMEKVVEGISSREQRRKKVAEREKNNKASVGTAFASSDIAVRPLKESLAAPKPGKKKKKGIVSSYSAAEAAQLLKQNKLNFKKPFIVKNAIKSELLVSLQKKFTANSLLGDAYKDVRVRYVSPKVLKKGRSWDPKPNTPGQEEQLEARMINFERWLVNCFNLKARPDFKKSPGSDTEHCEQKIPSKMVDKGMQLPTKLFADLNFYIEFTRGKEQFLQEHYGEIRNLIGELAPASTLGLDGSSVFVMGSAGSGEQLSNDRDGLGSVHSLIHGKRRWFFMDEASFSKLRQEAREVMEPASAFVFFEQQLGELIEDFDLGNKKMPFSQVNQLPGDVLFVPPSLIYTSLALHDSLSYVEKFSPSSSAIIGMVNSKLWDPGSGVVPNSFSVATCFGLDFEKIAPVVGGPQIAGQQGQMIAGVMQQFGYGGGVGANSVVLRILADCNAVAVSPSLAPFLTKTLCAKIWKPCVAKLGENAVEMGLPKPEWLSAKVPAFNPLGSDSPDKTEL